MAASLLMKNPTYVSWQSMKQRCARALRYRIKGITFDKRWESYKNFLEDMGSRPSGTTLEREDNDGDYVKENCRWATQSEQCRNRDSSLKYFYRGKERTVAEISELTEVRRSLLYQRLKRGWELNEAISWASNKGNRNDLRQL